MAEVSGASVSDRLSISRLWKKSAIPVWLARLVAGETAVLMGTEARGASNAKARRELGWTPEHYPSWRQGFAEVYAKAASASAAADMPARTRADIRRAP